MQRNQTSCHKNQVNTMVERNNEEFDKRGELSPVNQMFNGRSVFITGASGFIGRVLLEKLLRCYQGIRRIYILMRPKKNMLPAERLHKQLLNVPIFDKIRAMDNGQELLAKIVIVSGDIGDDKFGLSDADLKMMLGDETLSIVYHSAATVKFDEPLNNSIKFNLKATQTIIELCKQMPNLLALCHVSTAFVNSDKKNNETIEETIYTMQQTPHTMIELSKLIDDELMQQVKPVFVGDRPNTYTFTKALGEHLIALDASELPVAIVRPSIVTAAWKDPLPGWVDNLNGPTGLILATGKGLMRSMHARHACKADIIPVDIVVNTMIAASYYAAKTSGKLGSSLGSDTTGLQEIVAVDNDPLQLKEDNNAQTDKVEAQHRIPLSSHASGDSRVPPIFHCTSGDINPIKWGDMQAFMPIIRKYPSARVLRYPFGTFKDNKYHDMITRLFVHFLPALIIDLICMVMGKKRQLLSVYFKLHSAVEALSHFTTTNYNFQSRNISKLHASLTHPLDKEQLFMDISTLNWTEYWHSYVLGARRYVLKEDDQTLGQAQKSFQRALYIEYAFRTLLVLFALLITAPMAIRIAPSLHNLITFCTTTA